MDTQKDLVKVRTTVHEDYSDMDRQRDLVVVYLRATVQLGKLYAPSIALGALAIASFTSAHKIQKSRIAGITAAYVALQKGFDEYRGRVRKELGENKDREFLYGVTEERETITKKGGTPKEIVRKKAGEPSVYARLFDESNPNWSRQPEYNVTFLRAQQNYLNDLLKSRGHVLLNDAYDALGIDRTPAGSQVGWLYLRGTGDDIVDFGIWDSPDRDKILNFLDNSRGAVMLDFNVDGVIWKGI